MGRSVQVHELTVVSKFKKPKLRANIFLLKILTKSFSIEAVPVRARNTNCQQYLLKEPISSPPSMCLLHGCKTKLLFHHIPVVFEDIFYRREFHDYEYQHYNCSKWVTWSKGLCGWINSEWIIDSTKSVKPASSGISGNLQLFKPSPFFQPTLSQPFD